MTNLVIFSVEELYKLIHDEPVFDNKSQTLYMSQDCYENGNYDNELYMGIDLANGTDFTGSDSRLSKLSKTNL
jgi:hypothetical protein